LLLPGLTILPGDIRTLYYRRPTIPGLEEIDDVALREWAQNEYRRALGGFLLQVPKQHWVDHPLAISGASYKPEQLIRARSLGLLVPDTVITRIPEEAYSFCEAHHWQVVAKPVGHGELIRDGIKEAMFTTIMHRIEREEFAPVSVTPTLFQAAIQKKRDIRVTVVGGNCISVAIQVQTNDIDFRRAALNENVTYEQHELDDHIAEKCKRLVYSYDLKFAGIDLLLDSLGNYWFLEINPNCQWAWLDIEADSSIGASLAGLATSTERW
jgi:glutathione synthase/RimK-type ligase-like ATP-grasp enzyme